MAGYSTTPLSKKLVIKPGNTLALLHAPHGFSETLEPLPEEVTLLDELELMGSCDRIVAFYISMEQLEKELPLLREALTSDGRLWLAWPKRASRLPTDLCDGVVRDLGLESGLVDVKVCAIDETWSGLCFMFRLKDRPT